MIVQSEIDQLVSDIVKGYKPDKIYLFGSFATNTATANSDLDLLILKATNTRRKDRAFEILSVLQSYPSAGIDFIVYTPDELLSVQNDVMNIAKEAIKTGKLLYERI